MLDHLKISVYIQVVKKLYNTLEESVLEKGCSSFPQNTFEGGETMYEGVWSLTCVLSGVMRPLFLEESKFN